MIIKPQTDPFPYLLIDEYFSQEELAEVMTEIMALKPYAGGAEESGAMPHAKSGSGLFLDVLFHNKRHLSRVLELNRKIYNQEIIDAAEQTSVFYRHIGRVNKDISVINFYHDSEEYHSHHDKNTISTVWFARVGNITGGEFEFTQDHCKIDSTHNRMVIFPGCVDHKVHPVYSNDGGYRVSMAQFLCYKN